MKCLVDECRLVTIDEFCPAHRDEEARECDACGELVHDDGKGESHRGMIHAAMIDPPDESWICSECVARVEDAEISRAEDARDLYYYEK